MKGNKIKNLGKSLVAIVATLLLAIAATTATSCKDLPWVKGSHETQVIDSTRFVQQFESIVNPKITVLWTVLLSVRTNQILPRINVRTANLLSFRKTCN